MSTRRALKVLYIGDIMAQPGIDVIEQVLPQVGVTRLQM
jgi:calcineurin-like phosphoesterase